MVKRRVIIAISSSLAGGAQIYIANLIEQIKNEYDIAVICPPGYLYSRLTNINVDLIKSDINILSIFSIRKYILNQKKQYNRIVLNTHLLGTTFWIVLASIFIDKIRIVSTLHQPIIYNNISCLKKTAFPMITKFVSKYVDEFICVSREITDSVIYYTNRDAKYIANSVPNIENKKTIAVRPENKIINIGIIGRLTASKNHLSFLSAAKLITEKLSRVHFYIIGDGELMGTLKARVLKDEMNDKVTFTGFINEPAKIIREMDIVVFSSDFEGIPLALLETMSIGIPVVASNVGGISQVIEDGIDGILVPPRDFIAIKDAVLRLCNNEKLYQKIQFNSVKKMQTEYSYEKNIKAYTAIINGEEKKDE
jgi:glycosyltransferase involved in cell wall biosynthesis